MSRGLPEASAADAEQADSSAMIDWLATQHEEGGYVSYLHDVECGLAAGSPPSTGSGAVAAALTGVVPVPAVPGLSCQLSIGNSSLPVRPILDGLLKPS